MPEWGHVYEIYVTAVNQSGESGGSSHVLVRVGPPDGTWACATASGSSIPGLGSVPAQKYGHPSATICGYRDGSRINMVKSWHTSNFQLLDGGFRYQVWDCDTGALVHDDHSQMFETPTNTRSWTGTGWIFIDWTHHYRVRIVGGGHVVVPGNRHATFSSAPAADPRFDRSSVCF